jgi:hypothetical protein
LTGRLYSTVDAAGLGKAFFRISGDVIGRYWLAATSNAPGTPLSATVMRRPSGSVRSMSRSF